MSKRAADKGTFPCGIPFNRLGRGPKPLVIFQGLVFENKPQPAMMVRSYAFLGEAYTVYSVVRRPGLPEGCTLSDMGDAYAVMIREEFGGPVDVIGLSTGGSIAQPFAADHPDLVRRLVIHSSAYTLSENARRLQWRVGELAAEGRWREAYTLVVGAVMPQEGLGAAAGRPLGWVAGSLMAALDPPASPADLIATVRAEDSFNFKDRLGQITAPTLVVAGEKDPFYTPELFRETAAGIPGARLILYPGQGHPAGGKQFERDVLDFLQS